MATKYFCDGCGKERKGEELTEITISTNQPTATITKFDLDADCLKKFKRELPPDYRPKDFAPPPLEGDFP